MFARLESFQQTSGVTHLGVDRLDRIDPAPLEIDSVTHQCGFDANAPRCDFVSKIKIGNPAYALLVDLGGLDNEPVQLVAQVAP